MKAGFTTEVTGGTEEGGRNLRKGGQTAKGTKGDAVGVNCYVAIKGILTASGGVSRLRTGIEPTGGRGEGHTSSGRIGGGVQRGATKSCSSPSRRALRCHRQGDHDDLHGFSHDKTQRTNASGGHRSNENHQRSLWGQTPALGILGGSVTICSWSIRRGRSITLKMRSETSSLSKKASILLVLSVENG